MSAMSNAGLVAAPGVAGGSLAFTGVGVGWQIVAAATLVATGGAVVRMLPRRSATGRHAALNR